MMKISIPITATIQADAMKTEIREYGPNIISESPISARILLKSQSFEDTFLSFLSIYSIIMRQRSRKTRDMKI